MNLLDMPYNIKYGIICHLDSFNLNNLFWTHSSFQEIVLRYLNNIKNKEFSNINLINYEIFNLSFNLINNNIIKNHYMFYYTYGYNIFSDRSNKFKNYTLKLIHNHRKNISSFKQLDVKENKYFELLLLYYRRHKKMI
jgi:hypothetical protein